MTGAVEATRPDHPRVLPDGTVLRPLSGDRGELEACVDLQRAIWGPGFADVASPQILRIVQAMGGVAAAAFDDAGAMLGFVFGITGLEAGRPLHWSHMLAVLPRARGRDLGYHLKLYQRERLLPLGIDTMRWTYDPLVSKNANLNLIRLGTRVISYRRDYYGSGEDSVLSAGLGTDRFIVEWRLAEALPDTGGGLQSRLVDRAVREAPVANGGADLASIAVAPLPIVRIEVPEDIQKILRDSPDEAVRWRAETRRAFENHLEHGFEVTGFYRDFAAGGRPRSYYVMRKAES